MSSTPPPPVPPPPAPAPAAPAKKSNTLVIVICVVLGVILLLLGSCVATCMYVGKKAQAYAAESEKNPELSALAIAAALHPGVEVVAKDLDAGTLVLKNKKTGETVKIDARDINQDNIGDLLERIVQGKSVGVARSSGTATASSSRSESASTSSGGDAGAVADTQKQLPPDFPVYTGRGVTTLETSQQSLGGMSTVQHVFETGDSPAAVAAFFAAKLGAAGYKVTASEDGTDGNGATINRVFQKDGASATVTINARIEGGKTQVEVNRLLLKQP